MHTVLRLRGAGGNDRIPGQEEVIEYASSGRRPRIQYNSDPGRQTPFWLCAECGNMLYPKEDVNARSLRRICRHCRHDDAADSNLVFVNDQRPPNAVADAGSDVTKDPTLPRATNTVCTNCGHTESVFFQAPARGDEGMKLIFMCTRYLATLKTVMVTLSPLHGMIHTNTKTQGISPLQVIVLGRIALSCAYRWVQ